MAQGLSLYGLSLVCNSGVGIVKIGGIGNAAGGGTGSAVRHMGSVYRLLIRCHAAVSGAGAGIRAGTVVFCPGVDGSAPCMAQSGGYCLGYGLGVTGGTVRTLGQTGSGTGSGNRGIGHNIVIQLCDFLNLCANAAAIGTSRSFAAYRGTGGFLGYGSLIVMVPLRDDTISYCSCSIAVFVYKVCFAGFAIEVTFRTGSGTGGFLVSGLGHLMAKSGNGFGFGLGNTGALANRTEVLLGTSFGTGGSLGLGAGAPGMGNLFGHSLGSQHADRAAFTGAAHARSQAGGITGSCHGGSGFFLVAQSSYSGFATV